MVYEVLCFFAELVVLGIFVHCFFRYGHKSPWDKEEW
jgi:hypothetical protein